MNFEYFTIRTIGRKPKTNIYEVTSKHGDVLGIIKWFGRWRQYCFFPEIETVFSTGCLKDVQTALDQLNQKHRGKVKT